MVCFSAVFFKDFTTCGLLRILTLFIRFEKHFSHYFFRFFSVLASAAHNLKFFFFFLFSPSFLGPQLKGLQAVCCCPHSSLMPCPFAFGHPFSFVSRFRVFVCYQVSFFPCNVQFTFNLISIFLISDTVFHPEKFDLDFILFFFCLFCLASYHPHAFLYFLSS